MSKKQARQIVELLRPLYGPVSLERSDPLDQLIRTMLSQRTTSANCRLAFGQLKEAFPTWEEVLESRISELERLIRPAGLANQKAPRIKQVLANIRGDFGCLSLNLLEKKTTKAVEEYLLTLPGVGPKTARCVLIFALGRDILPVDTHLARFGKRFGLIDPETRSSKVHDALQAHMPTGLSAEFHVLVFEHGRAVCQPRKPKCDRCVLRGICGY